MSQEVVNYSEENLRHIVARLCQRPIAFNPSFTRLPDGSVSSALFLSQALYWTDRSTDKDGWFYKTRDEWTLETGLSRWEQERARKSLRDCGVLEERLCGTPATVHYRVNCTKLVNLLSQLVGGNTSNQLVEKPPTGWRENHQLYKEAEITTENTQILDSLFPQNPSNKTKKFKIPTIEQIREYCSIRRNSVDPEKFWNYYQSKGWVVGKSPMKDWQAAVRTWEGNEHSPTPPKIDEDISPSERLHQQLASGNRKAASS